MSERLIRVIRLGFNDFIYRPCEHEQICYLWSFFLDGGSDGGFVYNDCVKVPVSSVWR